MNIASPAIIYSTTLRPHRSASRQAINWLIGILTVAFALTGLGFSLIGAWPVMGFFGLDIALLAGAFYLNNRSGRACEVIDLTAEELKVRRIDPWGRERAWSFQPQWLNINLNKAPQGVNQLEVRSHGKALIIGAFLGPDERQQACENLRQALKRLNEVTT
ncbi:MAG: DUF2244 domain-containing protein [Rhodospirillales bacterium]|jgi:uncharacterized membrane protein